MGIDMNGNLSLNQASKITFQDSRLGTELEPLTNSEKPTVNTHPYSLSKSFHPTGVKMQEAGVTW